LCPNTYSSITTPRKKWHYLTLAPLTVVKAWARKCERFIDRPKLKNAQLAGMHPAVFKIVEGVAKERSTMASSSPG
jgi:hypothetical protein